MVKVRDILEFIYSIAPAHMKESWDNVGLNCGRMDAEVSTVLVALDPFLHVCEEAKEVGAELLLTHHALIWEPGFVTDDTPTGRRTLFLIENGIAHINAHTNLDCAPGGVNDCLAKVLGLSDIQVMNPVGTDENGRPYGLLRQGITNVQPLEDFLAHVKTSLGCEGLRYVNSRKPVHKIAVGGGACAGALEEVAKAGCDTFVTADTKYNQFRDAFDLGLNLIDAGHFHTEAPVIAALAEKISGAFPDIQVKISEKHGDVMKFC